MLTDTDTNIAVQAQDISAYQLKIENSTGIEQFNAFQELIQSDIAEDEALPLFQDFTFEIGQKDPHGLTLLDIAIYANKPKIVKKLVLLGSDPLALDEYGNTPVLLAHICNNQEVINILSSMRAQINNVWPIDIKANYPLHFLVSEKARKELPLIQIIKLILTIVLPGNFQALNNLNADMQTALHVACSNNFIEAALLLHDLGAKTDVKDNAEKNPLEYVTSPLLKNLLKNQEPLIHFIASKAMQTNNKNISKAELIAIISQYPDYNLDRLNKYGFNAVTIAVTHLQFDALESLYLHGANLGLEMHDHNALFYANKTKDTLKSDEDLQTMDKIITFLESNSYASNNISDMLMQFANIKGAKAKPKETSVSEAKRAQDRLYAKRQKKQGQKP